MTPEEKATQVLDVPEEQLSDYRGEPCAVYLHPRIAQAIREAKAEAYEEAARMACTNCLNHLRVERRDGSDGDWYHPAQSYWPEMDCAASGIRALKDARATEAVTTQSA